MKFALRGVAIAMAILAAMPASAATIIYGGPGLQAVPQFNPSIGTLNSVTVSAGFEYRLTFLGASSRLVQLTGSFGFADEGPIAVNRLVTSSQLNPMAQYVQIFDGITTTFTADLARFIGTGTRFVGESYDIAAINPADGTIIHDGGFIGGGGALGYGSITYDYVAAPFVPEPSTWLLMLAGFAMTGYTLRKRRVSVALAPTA